tara:strand:- start:260 stop:466 length:207 start_codon:yes stop_codon:yes gene_type:complete
MPVSHQCYYCGRKFITSSYGMWEHIENNCEAYKLYLKDKNIINIKNKLIQDKLPDTNDSHNKKYMKVH